MTRDGGPPAELWDVFEPHDRVRHRGAAGEHRVPADIHGSRRSETVAGPILEAIGATTRTDSAGNLIATFGPMSGRGTLFVAYPATLGNDTDDR